VMEVADEGHAPRLSDAGTASRIAAFLATCEAAALTD
jgi:hypothetical protein